MSKEYMIDECIKQLYHFDSSQNGNNTHNPYKEPIVISTSDGNKYVQVPLNIQKHAIRIKNHEQHKQYKQHGQHKQHGQYEQHNNRQEMGTDVMAYELGTNYADDTIQDEIYQNIQDDGMKGVADITGSTIYNAESQQFYDQMPSEYTGETFHNVTGLSDESMQQFATLDNANEKILPQNHREIYEHYENNENFQPDCDNCNMTDRRMYDREDYENYDIIDDSELDKLNSMTINYDSKHEMKHKVETKDAISNDKKDDVSDSTNMILIIGIIIFLIIFLIYKNKE